MWTKEPSHEPNCPWIRAGEDEDYAVGFISKELAEVTSSSKVMINVGYAWAHTTPKASYILEVLGEQMWPFTLYVYLCDFFFDKLKKNLFELKFKHKRNKQYVIDITTL